MSSEVELSGMLRAFESLLGEIERQAKEAPPNRRDAIIADNRVRVYAALNEIGEWLAEFYESHPPQAELAGIRRLFDDWLAERSQTVPTYAAVRARATNKAPTHDSLKLLFSSKAAGANVAAMVMSDFYTHSRFSAAGRWVLETLGEVLEQEVRARASQGGKRVNVTCLQYVGGMEWRRLADSPELLPLLNLTCVEATTDGTRDAQRDLDEHLRSQGRVVRREPLTFLEAPQRDTDAFDIVYAATVADWLNDEDVARLIRGAARVLRPGGRLITANLTPSAPTSEKVLRATITGRDWPYRDVEDWRRLYWSAPFDIDAARFMYEPSRVAMLMIASRR